MVDLPAREIPIPASISAEAQSVLAAGNFGPPSTEPPALDDVAGWKAFVAERDEWVWTLVRDRLDAFGGTIEERRVGSCSVYIVTPEGVSDDDRRTYFDIHGGGFCLGGGDVCKVTASSSATQLNARVWAPDYRMPPDHPYPSPLADCLSAYRALLQERDPDDIVVGGVSAGANLAAAMLLKAKDEGLPLPAALVLNTGALDLGFSGDSWRTNEGLDMILGHTDAAQLALYVGGHDVRDPYVSPVYGNVEGLPPTIVLTGTRDRLLSDNVRMHRALRAAGVDAELHVWEAASHGGFMRMAPEDAERTSEIRRFADAHWLRARAVLG